MCVLCVTYIFCEKKNQQRNTCMLTPVCKNGHKCPKKRTERMWKVMFAFTNNSTVCVCFGSPPERPSQYISTSQPWSDATCPCTTAYSTLFVLSCQTKRAKQREVSTSRGGPAAAMTKPSRFGTRNLEIASRD